MPTIPDPKVSDGFAAVLLAEGLLVFAILASLAAESPFIAAVFNGVFHGP